MKFYIYKITCYFVDNRAPAVSQINFPLLLSPRSITSHANNEGRKVVFVIRDVVLLFFMTCDLSLVLMIHENRKMVLWFLMSVNRLFFLVFFSPRLVNQTPLCNGMVHDRLNHVLCQGLSECLIGRYLCLFTPLNSFITICNLVFITEIGNSHSWYRNRVGVSIVDDVPISNHSPNHRYMLYVQKCVVVQRHVVQNFILL